MDTHLHLLAHSGELLAVPVRQQHERRPRVEAVTLGALALKGLAATPPPDVRVLLEECHLISRVRQAAGGAEPTDAPADDDGFLSRVTSPRAGWGGGARGAPAAFRGLGDGT
jgi:hypothetical protein